MESKKLTLALVTHNDKILLGLKKRGFGAGRWNGFGGKIEPGETVTEAAVRELQEEAGITATSLEKRGELTFEFKTNPLWLHVEVFLVRTFSGEPQETEEMAPQWFDISDIPYEKMWTDDKYWLPHFLDDKKFKGHFVFADMHRILHHTLDVV